LAVSVVESVPDDVLLSSLSPGTVLAWGRAPYLRVSSGFSIRASHTPEGVRGRLGGSFDHA